jgi:hypothetical protein
MVMKGPAMKARVRTAIAEADTERLPHWGPGLIAAALASWAIVIEAARLIASLI